MYVEKISKISLKTSYNVWSKKAHRPMKVKSYF